MTAKTTTTKCAACPRHLGTHNTNPDGLCGPCQGYLKRGSERYKAWLARGKPPLKTMFTDYPVTPLKRGKRADAQLALRIVNTAREEVSSNHVPATGLPPVDRLPLDYLSACVEEFKFRVGEARKVAAVAQKMGVR